MKRNIVTILIAALLFTTAAFGQMMNPISGGSSGTGGSTAWSALTGPILISGGLVYINNNPAVANFAFGNGATYALTTGVGDLFIGLHAGQLIADGINNTAIGWDSQMYNVSGQNNVSLGEDCLKFVLGSHNTAEGYTAGYSISTGHDNVAIGTSPLYNLQTGSYNVAVGRSAGQNTAVDSTGNTFIGYNAGNAATTNYNTFLGFQAGYSNTGASNIFLGYKAGVNETGSNMLYIDNNGRANTAALVYGVMDAAVANQIFTVNGNTTLNGAVNIKVNVQTGTSYTMADTDNFISFNNASAVTFQMRVGDATRTGRTLHLMNLGVGTVTITRFTPDVFIGNGSVAATTVALATGKSAQLTCDGVNHWSILVY